MLRGETSAKLQSAILTREVMAMILDMRMVRLKFIKSFENSSFVFLVLELAQLRTLKEEWRGWWGNRTNFLKEIAEEEGATVRFDEKGGPVSLVGPHRAIKKIGDAMRRERGGRRTAPRRRTSPPPRRSSPPPRRTSPGRTRGAPVGRGGVGSGAGGTSLRITFVITLSKVRKDLNIYFLLKIKQNINWSYHYIPDHHGNIQDSRST